MLDEEIRQKNSNQEGGSYIPYIYDAINHDVEIEFGEDDKPMVLTETDFLAIYRVPFTHSIKVELVLEGYEPRSSEKKSFSFYLD